MNRSGLREKQLAAHVQSPELLSRAMRRSPIAAANPRADRILNVFGMFAANSDVAAGRDPVNGLSGKGTADRDVPESAIAFDLNPVGCPRAKSEREDKCETLHRFHKRRQ